MSYSDIAWLPLAAGLTILGLVLSYFAYRRRGLRPALMGAAWSLLPLAAYLTGAIDMLWKIGAAIGKFGTGFVFSPEKWVGIGVTGLAIALFLAAGGRQRRRAAREGRRTAKAERGEQRNEASGRPDRAAVNPPDRTRALATRGAAKPADDDDMQDIEAILRKRGL